VSAIKNEKIETWPLNWLPDSVALGLELPFKFLDQWAGAMFDERSAWFEN